MPELLVNKPPIHAGPIIVDSWYHAQMDLEEEHITYSTFVIEALSHEISQGKATRAMTLAVSGLIAHLKLGILPPYDSIEGQNPWGPYDASNYYINPHGYAEHADVIQDYASTQTEDEQILDVLSLVRQEAEETVRLDKDRVPIRKLPDAFYTPQYPIRHMKSGRILSVEDFRLGGLAIQTSPAKAAQVFDAIIDQLGDEEAREQIRSLDVMVNPRTRVDIRGTLFVKTQAVVDFLVTFGDLPKEERKRFNVLALKLLRNIINDEERNS